MKHDETCVKLARLQRISEAWWIGAQVLSALRQQQKERRQQLMAAEKKETLKHRRLTSATTFED